MAISLHLWRLAVSSTSRSNLSKCDSESITSNGFEPEAFEGIEIAKLCEQRWGIEIRFRALKGSTHIRKMLSRQINKIHMEILLTAVMIFAHLTGRALSYFEKKRCKSNPLSIEKISNWLADSLASMKRVNCTCIYKLSSLCHDSRSRSNLAERLNSLF